MGHQYWVKHGEIVKGPFSGEQLKHLASIHKLKPHFYISSDREKWVRAERIRNLVFSNTATSSCTTSPTETQEPESSKVDIEKTKMAHFPTKQDRKNGESYRASKAKRKSTLVGCILLLAAFVLGGHAIQRSDEIRQLRFSLVAPGPPFDIIVLLCAALAFVYIVSALIVFIARTPWSIVFAAIVSIPYLLIRIVHFFLILIAPSEAFSLFVSALPRYSAILSSLAFGIIPAIVPLTVALGLPKKRG